METEISRITGSSNPSGGLAELVVPVSVGSLVTNRSRSATSGGQHAQACISHLVTYWLNKNIFLRLWSLQLGACPSGVKVSVCAAPY